MKLERFFEKFELFADAPDAVAKMRELVLQLAVRGKLVEQSDEDEPASEMLHRLTGRPPLLIDFGSLPSNWACVALGDLIALQKGKKPASLNVEKIGLPYLDIAALERGELRQFTEDSKCPRATTGDLIIVCDGSRSGLVLDGIDGVLGSTVSKVGHSGFDRNYLKYFLRSLYDDLNGAKKGAAIPHLNIPRLLAIPAQIPPLPEQKRIVAKVDELMALCDRLEAQQQERDIRHAALARASLARFAEAPAPTNLDFLFHPSYTITPADLRKSILTLAVQGKLVPQDPNDEPADELITRIAEYRRAKKAKVYEPVAMEEAPYEVPFSWSWVRLGNISLTSDSGWSPQCLPEARSGKDWGVLKVSAVSWGVFKPEENKALPPGMTARPDCEVKAGDFLLSRANTEELVARSVVVDQPPPGLMMSDKIVRFTFPDEIEKAFINLANSSEPARDYYAHNASGTSSSMKNIGREVMCNLPIPLPPLAEQRRIVAKVDQLMALVDQLETQLATSHATAEKLMEAVVAELTVQEAR